LALLMLFPIAKRLIVDFAEQMKAGIDRPVLDPDKFSDLEIDHSAWSGTQPQAKAGE
jgi:AGCS family alanine or glycine:cation symporter